MTVIKYPNFLLKWSRNVQLFKRWGLGFSVRWGLQLLNNLLRPMVKIPPSLESCICSNVPTVRGSEAACAKVGPPSSLSRNADLNNPRRRRQRGAERCRKESLISTKLFVREKGRPSVNWTIVLPSFRELLRGFTEKPKGGSRLKFRESE